MRRAAVLLALQLVSISPATSGAQLLPTPSDRQSDCATIFSATTTSKSDAVVVRILDLVRPFDGTIKAYAADRVWSAHVSTWATAARGGSYGPFARTIPPHEDSVLVRAGGPIEGIEFDPSWSSCAFRTGVRQPNNTDGPEIARPTVVASDSQPLDPIACATPYVATTLTRAAPADTPALAQQQGITGTARLFVSLDERGGVTSTRILSSPSAILNNAALAAARASTYRGAVFRCKPIPSGYLFAVDFS